MLKKMFQVVVLFAALLLFFPSAVFAEADVSSATQAPSSHLAHLYHVKGKDVEAKLDAFTTEKMNTIGYELTDAHKRINDVFKKLYGSTQLDILSFLPVIDDTVVKPLLNTDPRLAGFNPFNLLIYKKMGEEEYHIGHLTANAILDIVGITDPAVRDAYTKSLASLDKMLDETFGKENSYYLDYKQLPKKRMMQFVLKFDRPKDLADFLDAFQEKFEDLFADHDYVIAGFHDFRGEEDNGVLAAKYDAFWAYSMCHMKYSATVFDGKGARPEAGLFAPCVMYMYIPKGSDKLMIGMPRVENVKYALEINDKTRADIIDKIDHEIVQLMVSELGVQNSEKSDAAVAGVAEKAPKQNGLSVPSIPKKVQAPVVKVEKVAEEVAQKSESRAQTSEKIDYKEGYRIVLPTPPTPVNALKVITVGGSDITYKASNETDPIDHKIIFSERRPPDTGEENSAAKEAGDDETMPGLPQNGKVSAYLRAPYRSVEGVKHQLTQAGFKVLGVFPVDKKGNLQTITFTDDDLLAMARKNNSAFVGVMRLLVDHQNNQISVTNPLYFAKAFMGEAYDEKRARKVLQKLNSTFKGLKNSKDRLKYTLLPKYRFMAGMPFYKDMVTVAKAESSVALLQKLKTKNGGKMLQFVQQIGPESYLTGVKLGNRTSKFVKKIGTNNASLLPYPIWIDKGVAKILEPKYYIAINYPMLKMSNFMKIATVPDAIHNDCEELFR
ncbi:MAG: hypothetical protein DSZ05_00860 [Sulfurospirillum sp.]|nr:MAG: hypothetical protein DSZ05_00860 [Sulfurospirillum sp.]